MAGVPARAAPPRALRCKRGHDLYDGHRRRNDCLASVWGVGREVQTREGGAGPMAHWSRASGRSARAGTSAHGPAAMSARNRAPRFRTDGSGRAAPASSTRRPTGRSVRSPRRHSWSMSADAGTRARSARRGCGDRAGSVRARARPDRGRCGPEPLGGDFAGSWTFHPQRPPPQPNCGNAPGHRRCGKFRRFPAQFQARPESLPPLKRAGKTVGTGRIRPTSIKKRQAKRH